MVNIPNLKVRHFKKGAPPEFLFQEDQRYNLVSQQVKLSFQSNITEILQKRFMGKNLTWFFDQFRSGELTHPLLRATNSLKKGNTWLNFSSADMDLKEALHNKDFDYSDTHIFWSFSQKWMSFKSQFLKPLNWNFQMSSQHTPVSKKVDLITDFFGPFQTSLEPDKVLALYLEMTNLKAPIFIHLGPEYTGFGALSEVILKTGEKISFRKWLLKIPGLNIKFYRGGYAWSGGQWTFVKITSSNSQVIIPSLQIIGIGKSTDNELPKLLFEEI